MELYGFSLVGHSVWFSRIEKQYLLVNDGSSYRKKNSVSQEAAGLALL